MKFLFCPSIHECPSEAFSHFEIFGMGPEAAKKLANKLNLLYPRSHILVLGSAAALNPQLKSGEAFVISEIKTKERNYRLRIPEEIQHLPQASVTSSREVVKDPKEKVALWKDLGADLVDCESQFVFEELLDQFQDQLLIVRAVIDEQKDHMNFIEGNGVKWSRLGSPKNFIGFFKLIRSYTRYREGISQIFEKLIHALHWEGRLRDEDSEADLIF